MRDIEIRHIHFKNHASQKGVGMIEVLITLVILAVGLLGVASLQFVGSFANKEALARTQAVLVTQQMTERLRAATVASSVTDGFVIHNNYVDDDYYITPIGKASIAREGSDVTILAYGTMVYVAMAAAEEAEIDAEVVDLRSLVPLDTATIKASVEKTGRCVVLHEATRTSGFGAELMSVVQELCFYHLEAPVVRVTGWDTPYPHAQEWNYFPGPARVAENLRKVMGA